MFLQLRILARSQDKVFRARLLRRGRKILANIFNRASTTPCPDPECVNMYTCSLWFSAWIGTSAFAGRLGEEDVFRGLLPNDRVSKTSRN